MVQDVLPLGEVQKVVEFTVQTVASDLSLVKLLAGPASDVRSRMHSALDVITAALGYLDPEEATPEGIAQIRENLEELARYHRIDFARYQTAYLASAVFDTTMARGAAQFLRCFTIDQNVHRAVLRKIGTLHHVYLLCEERHILNARPNVDWLQSVFSLTRYKIFNDLRKELKLPGEGEFQIFAKSLIARAELLVTLASMVKKEEWNEAVTGDVFTSLVGRSQIEQLFEKRLRDLPGVSLTLVRRCTSVAPSCGYPRELRPYLPLS